MLSRAVPLEGRRQGFISCMLAHKTQHELTAGRNYVLRQKSLERTRNRGINC
jgi:hypothetical protein